MLPPHIHPRAANYVVATMGNTTTYMWEENGAHLITTNLTPGKATLFPAGAMHMMVNTGRFLLWGTISLDAHSVFASCSPPV